MIDAIIDEILLKKSDWQDFTFESIYFGGGTPSILEENEYNRIIEAVKNNFRFSTHVELTLEANPDDINPTAVKKWKSAGINRLSIGLQSLNNEELVFMNRSHTAAESMIAVDTRRVSRYFHGTKFACKSEVLTVPSKLNVEQVGQLYK